MKVGIITQPNQKGQVVIPKEYRDELGISEKVSLNMVLRGKGIYVYPIKEVICAVDSESSYVEVLKKTQGSWSGDDWDSVRAKRKKIELSASQDRKKAW